MSDLEEFSIFPSLPKEVRLMIWEYTLPHRVLRLRCLKEGLGRAHANNLYMLLFRPRSKRRSPPPYENVS